MAFETEPKPPQMCEQYSKQGWMRPIYSLNSCSDEKYLRHQNKTPSFFKPDLAIWSIWAFQDKLEEICTPKIFIEERDSIKLFSNKICGSEEFVREGYR